MSSDNSDCELRDDWFLEQDLNAWSSLAYVVAGLLLAWEVHRSRLPRAVWGLAAVVAAEGVGSLLYHGAASDVSQFLHDVPLIGALAFVAGWHVGRLRDRADAGSLVGLAVGLAVSTVLWAVAPQATNITAAVAVAVIVVASLLARRRAMAGVWSWPLLALGAVAVSMWGLGTPDSPVCDADSWLQAHAVWHVLTAIVALPVPEAVRNLRFLLCGLSGSGDGPSEHRRPGSDNRRAVSRCRRHDLPPGRLPDSLAGMGGPARRPAGTWRTEIQSCPDARLGESRTARATPGQTWCGRPDVL